MDTNESYVGTSHNLLNYSGMLFAKGNSATPFSTLMRGRARTVQTFSFAMGQDYTIAGGQSQPSITETASLTAPNASFVTRSQLTNYCQIYQEAISLSYGKLSSMDMLAGLNIGGEVANPANELDFQVAARMKKIAKDIEYVFLNGTGQQGTYDDVAYKTQGIIGGISTNSTSASSAPLGYWLIASAFKAVVEAGSNPDDCVLFCNPVHLLQLNADAASNGLTIVPSDRTVNGIRLRGIETPFGFLAVQGDGFIAAGTAVIADMSICAPVYMPVPGKGNFFLESLAKSGAADKYQIYGQVGLDYGAEWRHAKITSLASSFTAPDGTRKVLVTNPTTSPVHTDVIT